MVYLKSYRLPVLKSSVHNKEASRVLKELEDELHGALKDGAFFVKIRAMYITMCALLTLLFNGVALCMLCYIV